MERNEEQIQAIKDLQSTVHELAHENGWWDSPREMGTLLALVHSEISEALEALRKGDPMSDKINRTLFEEELADTVIRILDIAEHKDLNLGEAIFEKLEMNRTRGYRHNNKSF